MIRAVALLALVACGGEPGQQPTDPTQPTSVPTPQPTGTSTDQDLDGYATPWDCDDTDPSVHPEAEDEPYDGVDADCAGDSDYDADLDGFDSADHGGDDCDDTDETVFPGGTEVCDGRDGDCDGQIDSPTPPDADTWYRDYDGDGQGDPYDSEIGCFPSSGYTSSPTDCDDTDPYTFFGAGPVPCDGVQNDCDATVLETAGGAVLNGIQHASLDLALAAAVAGDTIEVCEGHHTVNDLDVTAGVTLAGVPDQTTLDGSGSGPLLQVTTTDPVTLSGLTLTGGMGFPVGGEVVGGGLRAVSGANVTLTDVVVEVNHAGWGAGIHAGAAATLVLQSSRVEFNNADLCATTCSGGGIVTGAGSTVVLDGSSVTDNLAGQCAGVELGLGSTLEGLPKARGVVNDNLANQNGGGICASRVAISYLNVHGNNASVAGGLDVHDADLLDVEVRYNEAIADAGGISAGGDCTLDQVRITDNEAESGGGVYFFGGGTLEMTGGEVTNNDAWGFGTVEGGGVEVVAGTLISNGVDWATGATDNTPSDVALSSEAVTHDETGVATFTCDSALGSCQ